MKKLIHVKILDDNASLDEVQLIGDAIRTSLEDKGLNDDYVFMVTSSLFDVSMKEIDEMIEELQKKKRE